jgi:hypothetical protein
MIKKHYGRWPKKPVPGKREPGERAFDAKHWDEILIYNGWECVPIGSWLLWPNHCTVGDFHYIGLLADEGEFGQLVWFLDDDRSSCAWRVSTYKDFKKVEYSIQKSEKSGIVWYRKVC